MKRRFSLFVVLLSGLVFTLARGQDATPATSPLKLKILGFVSASRSGFGWSGELISDTKEDAPCDFTFKTVDTERKVTLPGHDRRCAKIKKLAKNLITAAADSTELSPRPLVADDYHFFLEYDLVNRSFTRQFEELQTIDGNGYLTTAAPPGTAWYHLATLLLTQFEIVQKRSRL